jgi:hypothetical protein
MDSGQFVKFSNEEEVAMKVLIYSSRSYDKAFPESANHGK